MDDELDKEWRDLLRTLATRIEEDFGERCSETEPLCPICALWRMHDDLYDIVGLDAPAHN